jgi:hypothetical protein
MTVLLVDDRGGVAATRFFAAVASAVTSGRFWEFIEEHLGASSGSSSKKRIAFDCEGINLSRIGTGELVSLCFEDAGYVYLVDLSANSNRALRAKRVEALKTLFACDTVEKVIHDCRMDCDALFHIFGTEVINVHDTSCFLAVISGREGAGLLLPRRYLRKGGRGSQRRFALQRSLAE